MNPIDEEQLYEIIDAGIEQHTIDFAQWLMDQNPYCSGKKELDMWLNNEEEETIRTHFILWVSSTEYIEPMKYAILTYFTNILDSLIENLGDYVDEDDPDFEEE